MIVRTPEGWRFKKRDEKGLDQAATRRLSPVVLPARQHATERELPPIHDITTDTDDPVFVAVLAWPSFSKRRQHKTAAQR